MLTIFDFNQKTESNSQLERKRDRLTTRPVLRMSQQLGLTCLGSLLLGEGVGELRLSEVSKHLVLGRGPSRLACLKFLFLNWGTESQMLQTLTSAVKSPVPLGGGDHIITVNCPFIGLALAHDSYLSLLSVVSKTEYLFLFHILWLYK